MSTLSTLNAFIQDIGCLIRREYAGSLVVEAQIINLINFLSPIDAFYPPFQRELDLERITALVNEQKEEFKRRHGYGIIHSPIILGHCSQLSSEKNKCGIFIVDGQHRLNVLLELIKFSPQNLEGVIISIRIYKANNLTDLQEYYIKINKNFAPHLLYDLDEIIKSIIDGIIQWIENTYDRGFFTTSLRANRPNMNIRQLRTELSNSKRLKEVIENCGENKVACVKGVCEKFSKYNQELSTKNYTFFMEKQTDAERVACFNAIKKCAESPKPLYLGLQRNYLWIDEALKPEKIKISFKQSTSQVQRVQPLVDLVSF